MDECCKAMESTGKSDKNGNMIMRKCCTRCYLHIFYDKDPDKKRFPDITFGNLDLVRNRMILIPGLMEELKGGCPGLSEKTKESWGDGLPQLLGTGKDHKKQYSIQCGTK